MICKRIKTYQKESSNPKMTLVDKSRGSGKSKFILENKSRGTYYALNFEKDVYQGNAIDTKCDFGLKIENEKVKTIYFIELKGTDVNKGIEQLLATLEDTQKCFKGFEKKARLVVSRFPKPELTYRTRAYKDLVRKTKKEIIIKQHQIVEVI
ncbi:MAG: hypothetical protein GQ574_06435 [Crocinitomix sp.]|nr:hypothetical protein [Crocinitomix sp.]